MLVLSTDYQSTECAVASD